VERAAHVVHNLAGSDLSVKWALVQAQVLDKIRVVLSSSQNQTILIECCGTMGELALAMGQEEFFFEAGLTYALVGCLA
jgi:ribosomal protein L2